MHYKLKIIIYLVFVYSIGKSQNITSADSSLCDSIKRKPEKYEGKATYYSPSEFQISFTKIYYKNKPSTYILLQAKGTAPAVINSVSILLENNEQLHFPKEKIDAEPGFGKNWNYSVFIVLSQTEITKLAKHSIKNYKLNSHEETLTLSDQKLVKGYLNCMTHK